MAFCTDAIQREAKEHSPGTAQHRARARHVTHSDLEFGRRSGHLCNDAQARSPGTIEAKVSRLTAGVPISYRPTEAGCAKDCPLYPGLWGLLLSVFCSRTALEQQA